MDNPVLKRHVDIIEYTKMGMTKRVIELIANNADVNERDYSGNYAVLHAAERNDFKTLKVLVEAGADLNVHSGNGITPLGYAQGNKNPKMQEYIESNLNRSNLKPK